MDSSSLLFCPLQERVNSVVRALEPPVILPGNALVLVRTVFSSPVVSPCQVRAKREILGEKQDFSVAASHVVRARLLGNDKMRLGVADSVVFKSGHELHDVELIPKEISSINVSDVSLLKRVTRRLTSWAAHR